MDYLLGGLKICSLLNLFSLLVRLRDWFSEHDSLEASALMSNKYEGRQQISKRIKESVCQGIWDAFCSFL